MKLEVSNKRILKFYEENPTINFEAVNLIFIDLFDKLLLDMNGTMTTSIHSQLLTAMNDNMQDISEIKRSVDSLKDSMTSMNTEIFNTMTNKFMTAKHEYMEDMKSIIQTNTYEKLGPMIEKNNSVLIDKTTHLIGDIIPKSNSHYYSKINDSIESFYKSLSNDTTNLLKVVDQNSIKDFIHNFDLKSSMMLQNIQQPMYSFISASEERIQSNINNVKDGNHATQGVQQKIIHELSEILNKFREGNSSQQINDKLLHTTLTKLYSTSEVVLQNSHSSNSGILLKRIRKPTVLIQNKDCEQNISVEDINTFLHAIDEQNCNGIFLSQKSGISTKKNYQIEVHNNNIIVFLHNVEYNASKIEVAVDIIDNLSTKLRTFKTHNEDDCTIPKDLLDAINNEYQLFLTQKNAVIEVYKESQKKVLSQIDEIRFPSLDKYLSTKYSAPIQKPGLKCDMCKSFNANNLKALAAHKRGCARKNGNTIVAKTAVK